jgi:hypothetical protein
MTRSGSILLQAAGEPFEMQILKEFERPEKPIKIVMTISPKHQHSGRLVDTKATVLRKRPSRYWSQRIEQSFRALELNKT